MESEGEVTFSSIKYLRNDLHIICVADLGHICTYVVSKYH